ncbi:unnamed protein product [Symbiodinium sp. KB8]|nr:unnamed protein product [Symbiodinium sp. KB8]
MRRSLLRTFRDGAGNFVPRPTFSFDNHPHWFVGHMSKGKVKIEQKMKDVDVILEVRDARAPFTSAQFELTTNLPSNVQRLVVLNKADLVTPNVGLAMRGLIEEAGQPCLLTTAAENRNLIKIKQFALDNVRSKHPRTLGVMLMVVGLPNVGKSTIISGLKRIAFATLRHQGPNSKLMQGVKWTEPKMSNVPGLTRDVSFFQLSNHPRLYCYDTPGVSLLKKRNDPERNAKLGVLKCMPDHIAGEAYLADYLLYRLNRDYFMDYVRELELPGPTNDIRYLCAHISALLAHRNTNQHKSFILQACSPAYSVSRLPTMAFRALFVFLSFAAAFAEDVATALASDDVCEAGQDCSLELNQLRGIKVHYLEALEEDEEQSTQGEEEAELEGGGCTGATDMKIWKRGGKRSFDAALNSCGRGCAAGFPCTKDCMQKKGYSGSCASCMAQLVGCSRDHCMNQCITNDKVYTAQVGSGATFFLDLWRAGKLGKVCLDYVPDPDEVERLRRLRAQTEPPGPWGPACYPDVPDGLELSRRGPLLPEGFVPAGRHGFRSAVGGEKMLQRWALDGYNRAVAVLKLVYNFDPRSKNPKIKEMVATRMAELEGCARRLDPGQPGPPTSSARDAWSERLISEEKFCDAVAVLGPEGERFPFVRALLANLSDPLNAALCLAGGRV